MSNPDELLPLWFERGLVVATAGVLSFGGFGLLLAMVGHYNAMTAFGVGAVLTVLASLVAWPRPSGHSTGRQRQSRGVRYPAIGICVIALGCAVWNGIDAAQHVGVGRDPGVYVATGKWIATHGNLEVPVAAQWEANPDNISVLLPGTYAEGIQRLEFQFNHLMPVLLAEASNLGGDPLMFRVPAVLGALALCAVYAAGSRFVRRPWLVLAAVSALALSLPQLNVSRDTFSESSAELLLWSGLWLTLVAYQRRRFGVALLAGAALGGTLLSRVDAFVYLIPLPIVAALSLLAAGSSMNRRHMLKMHLGLLIGAVPLAALGTIDLIEHAGRYYANLHTQIDQLKLGMVASVLLAAALLVLWPILGHRATDVTRRVAAHRQSLAVASALTLVLGLFASWGLRPALTESHGVPVPLIEALQRRAGLPFDSTRIYSEYSLTWISWYLGPVTVTLAIFGVGLVIARMWRRVDAADALVLAVAGLGSAIYVWRPSIAPDQIWAMRRFVPSTLPLLLLLAAVSIAALGRVVASSVAGAPWQRPVVAVGAVALLVFPLGTTLPVAHFKPQARHLILVEAVCKTVGPRGAILIAANDSGGLLLSTSLRAWCDVPVAKLKRPQSPADILLIARSWQADGRTLWVVGSSADKVTESAPGLTPRVVASVINHLELEMTIQRAPQSYQPTALTLYAGSVTA